MEEAIVDVALDHTTPPVEKALQPGVQEAMLTTNRFSIQIPPGAQKGVEEADLSLRKRAVRVEALRLDIAAGTYQIDTTELAFCILRNSTHFLETR
jgi:anti-sigma28 factor (negative regulator of flagellin synthesis)